jgi:hypothetical protein
MEEKTAFDYLHELRISLVTLNINSIIIELIHKSMVSIPARRLQRGTAPLRYSFSASFRSPGYGSRLVFAPLLRLFLLAAPSEARIMAALLCLLGAG